MSQPVGFAGVLVLLSQAHDWERDAMRCDDDTPEVAAADDGDGVEGG